MSFKNCQNENMSFHIKRHILTRILKGVATEWIGGNKCIMCVWWAWILTPLLLPDRKRLWLWQREFCKPSMKVDPESSLTDIFILSCFHNDLYRLIQGVKFLALSHWLLLSLSLFHSRSSNCSFFHWTQKIPKLNINYIIFRWNGRQWSVRTVDEFQSAESFCDCLMPIQITLTAIRQAMKQTTFENNWPWINSVSGLTFFGVSWVRENIFSGSCWLFFCLTSSLSKKKCIGTFQLTHPSSVSSQYLYNARFFTNKVICVLEIWIIRVWKMDFPSLFIVDIVSKFVKIRVYAVSWSLRVEFLLKTDSGYPKDTGVNKPWQLLGIPFAIYFLDKVCSKQSNCLQSRWFVK